MKRLIGCLLMLASCSSPPPPQHFVGMAVVLGEEPHCARNAMIPIPPPRIRTAQQIAAYANQQNAAREEEHAARNDCADKLHTLWVEVQTLHLSKDR